MARKAGFVEGDSEVAAEQAMDFDCASETLTREARRVARLGGAVSARDVARRIWRYRKGQQATALLCKLVRCRLGSWQNRDSGPRGGRPTRLFVPAANLLPDARSVLREEGHERS